MDFFNLHQKKKFALLVELQTNQQNELGYSFLSCIPMNTEKYIQQLKYVDLLFKQNAFIEAL